MNCTIQLPTEQHSSWPSIRSDHVAVGETRPVIVFHFFYVHGYEDPCDGLFSNSADRFLYASNMTHQPVISGLGDREVVLLVLKHVATAFYITTDCIVDSPCMLHALSRSWRWCKPDRAYRLIPGEVSPDDQALCHVLSRISFFSR